MAREYELKYRADAAAIAAIQEKYGGFAPITMETTYFDTPDLKLAFHHWMLRRRLENGESVVTFKRPLEDGSRAEWEVKNESVMMGILELCRQGAPAELMRCTAGGVMPMCGAKFTRLAATLEIAECTIELALDQGVFTGAKGEEPFAEVEVELKSGIEIAAVAFAENLAREFALEPEPKSKVQRAFAMAIY